MYMKKNSYKILVFDLDDTLIDNKENVKSAFATMLKEEGESPNEESFYRWYELDRKFWVDWQDGLIEIPDQLKHETGKKSDEFLDWVRSQRVLMYFDNSVSQERAIELNHIYMHSLNDVVVPVDGARDTLEYLSGKYKIIVATNGPRVATQQKLKKIDCMQFTTEVLSADMFGYMKPKVEFFEAIEQRYNDHDRSDYLIIGDSLKSDVGFGMNTGIDSCWFNRNGEKFDSNYSPTYTIRKLNELKKLL
jgi:2-haloacid dehalogenase